MASLQDQFLKAGLIDDKKIKQAHQEKSKQKKVERQTGTQSVDETRLAAIEAQRKKAKRARELNAQRDAAASHCPSPCRVSKSATTPNPAPAASVAKTW